MQMKPHLRSSKVYGSLHFYLHLYVQTNVPSVLWHCWLGVRKSIRPVKNWVWVRVGAVICLQRGADCLHMVLLMPLRPKTPTSLASYKSRLDWFYISGTGFPRLSWKRGRQTGVVVVVVAHTDKQTHMQQTLIIIKCLLSTSQWKPTTMAID